MLTVKGFDHWRDDISKLSRSKGSSPIENATQIPQDGKLEVLDDAETEVKRFSTQQVKVPDRIEKVYGRPYLKWG